MPPRWKIAAKTRRRIKSVHLTLVGFWMALAVVLIVIGLTVHDQPTFHNVNVAMTVLATVTIVTATATGIVLAVTADLQLRPWVILKFAIVVLLIASGLTFKLFGSTGAVFSGSIDLVMLTVAWWASHHKPLEYLRTVGRHASRDDSVTVQQLLQR